MPCKFNELSYDDNIGCGMMVMTVGNHGDLEICCIYHLHIK